MEGQVQRGSGEGLSVGWKCPIGLTLADCSIHSSPTWSRHRSHLSVVLYGIFRTEYIISILFFPETTAPGHHIPRILHAMYMSQPNKCPPSHPRASWRCRA